MVEAQQWQAQRLHFVPWEWRGRVERLHNRKLEKAAQAHGHQASELAKAANLWLLGTTKRMEALRVPVTLTDAELVELAKKCAQKALGLAGVTVSVTLTELRQKLEAFCNGYGITPPAPDMKDRPAVARLTCNLWWRRQLRKTQARALEAEAIQLGFVSRDREIYASTVTVERRAQQKRRNAEALAATEAVNQDSGEVYTLDELAAKSVANPKIRRGELMVRIKGFEHMAQGLGHVAEFVTITTPSKFHPKRTTKQGRAIDNPKYNGATPREAQQYLTKLWAQIRAKLARLNVRVYGFRVVEAHHDATPHWHLLLFMEGQHVATLRDVVRQYALREDGTEAGAFKNRCDFKAIDPKRGTATGYIAKYIAKNIDQGGYQVQGDVEGGDMAEVTASHRIEAWASTWGIRQFQQIGGAPVGVWRELRRLDAKADKTDTIKEAEAAATAGNWRRFVEVMGGVFVARKDMALRVAYTREGERWDFAKRVPYEAALTRYGETAAGAVFGVRDCVRGRATQSRRYRWELKKRNGAAVAPWTCINNCTQGAKHGESWRGGESGGAGVERCTDTHQSHGGPVCGAHGGGVAGHGGGNRPPEYGSGGFVN
jgi:hypothetical protein